MARPKNYLNGESMRTAGKKGQKRLDIILPGIGTTDDRIRKSYGRTQAEHAAFKQLLYDLHGAGNLEAIRMWLRDQLSGAQLLQLKRDHQLEASPSELTKDRPLFEDGELGPVVEEALGRIPKASVRTIEGYRKMWELLMKSGEVPAPGTVRCLLAVPWGDWHRHRWPYSEDYWNALRASVSVVLTMLFKKYHRFRLDVMELIPQVEIIGREPDTTMQDFEEIMAKVQPELDPCYRAILILGVRLEEFCAVEERHLTPPANDTEPGYVRVPKSKTPSGYREIPVDPICWDTVAAGVRVRMAVANYPRLERWWARACDLAGKSYYADVTKGGVKRRLRIAPRIHDLRHSISQWAADEGVELVALMRYLGHKNMGQTVRYANRRLRRQVSAAVGRVMKSNLKAI